MNYPEFNEKFYREWIKTLDSAQLLREENNLTWLINSKDCSKLGKSRAEIKLKILREK